MTSLEVIAQLHRLLERQTGNLVAEGRGGRRKNLRTAASVAMEKRSFLTTG